MLRNSILRQIIENQMPFLGPTFVSRCLSEKLCGYSPETVENFFLPRHFFCFEKSFSGVRGVRQATGSAYQRYINDISTIFQ
ncbi:MAG: hypothetical protein IKC19_01100, partial [Bacteroidales bacterium]|nr:hypothetical protein [Bacteroidales bacterium]